MPKFSEYFAIELSEHELDFVDVSNDYDTRVYVDPYAIEIQDDIWSSKASDYVRSFFNEVLNALRAGNNDRAIFLMSHLTEPKETFLGVSSGSPRGRGVGNGQARQLISAIRRSKAFKTGLISDISEMALYVEGIDRDKISDLTTNIIRKLLVNYTEQQCGLFNVPVKRYSGPPMWDNDRKTWISKHINIPHIEDSPVILVPKFIVRRKLSLDSQEFYNKQITDFLVAEHYRANDALVHMLRGEPIVYKTEVRKHHPKSKEMIADTVALHPELLEAYKDLAQKHRAMTYFDDESPSITSTCKKIALELRKIPKGEEHADAYHSLVTGALTTLFFPDLVQPHKEWEIHDGRKRIDIVFTNAADTGFFSRRRNDQLINANTVIIECKNYSKDIANVESDQLLGRFDSNRGKFGFITYRSADNDDLLMKRCKDAASRQQGYIIPLSDDDMIEMLEAKSNLNNEFVSRRLEEKFRSIIA
ncbi:hypothetical protein PMNALOAF_0711 [Methylobacterium adhaesivum]|uniref:Restriction endonuclease type IV Mrr domain-containing protein n=1 Tax=Methylobacterium adhaesivum TaxID=333297 RepID=A0ABT8BNQ5_9HYPH|nr:hypothetical protein [Methylobacterium adhaesivum]MDN3592841.1 hypothetical protein [Methylobacterium adhaesivum]GJD29478.1 hypothetical protein PMNALOAF_0711 [Methylobacterium adhaesivum]